MSKTGVKVDKAGRSSGIDHLRACITVVVVAFHAALGYVTFLIPPVRGTTWSVPIAPVVDERRWAGFDLFITFNNTFFMSLMFFISGLFVVPSLERKGAAAFLNDRAWRLGVPFLLGILFLSPLAYYPSFILTGSGQGYPAFWRDMVLIGPWPPGPLWFISMLLAFNLLVPPACRLFEWAGFRENPTGGFGTRIRRDPSSFFLVLMVLTIVAYMPNFSLYGPTYWVTWGAIANFQASRVLLYLAYFGFGVYFGARGLSSTFLGDSVRIGNRWWAWAFLAGISFVWYLGASKAMLEHFSPLDPWTRPTGWLSTGMSFATTCATISYACLVIFHRFRIPSSRFLDSLCVNAYGIYLLHYPFVIWTQYSLIDWPLDALAKVAIVFIVALLGSWVLVAFLRRFEVIGKVI